MKQQRQHLCSSMCLCLYSVCVCANATKMIYKKICYITYLIYVLWLFHIRNIYIYCAYIFNALLFSKISDKMYEPNISINVHEMETEALSLEGMICIRLNFFFFILNIQLTHSQFESNAYVCAWACLTGEHFLGTLCMFLLHCHTVCRHFNHHHCQHVEKKCEIGEWSRVQQTTQFMLLLYRDNSNIRKKRN